MKVEVKVPAMGESISEATIASIIKGSGSKVSLDDEIIELETDKVNQVLYAPQAGVLQLQVNLQDKVKVGQVIGYVDTEAKAQVEEKKEAQKKETMSSSPPKIEPEKKIESSVTRFQKADFLKDLEAPSKIQEAPITKPAVDQPKQRADARETRRPMSNIRKVIASRMVEVKNTTAMLTTFNEVDMSQVIGMREKYKEAFQQKYGVKLGFMSFFVKACVSALQQFPDLNSYIDGEEIVHREYFDIGVAVGTDRGVIVPVLRNCDQRSYAEIESFIEEFAKKARAGTINVDDLQGGSFTITNGGVYGSMLSTPIINPNQSAILGLHKITKRPIVIDDQITIRPIMYLALSYDHRIVDGKEAVSFLVHIKNALEYPGSELLFKPLIEDNLA